MMTCGRLFFLSLVSVVGTVWLDCPYHYRIRCFKIYPNRSFFAECPNGYGMSVYEFYESPAILGKQTMIQCMPMGFTVYCRFNDSINMPYQEFDFKCTPNAVITGIRYVFKNTMDDGIFSIVCCKLEGDENDKLKSVTNCKRWGENTSSAQFAQVLSAAKNSSLPMPGIAGFSSKYIRRYNPGTRYYKTREFIIDMCYVYD